MRVVISKVKIYSFEELNDSAKERVIDDFIKDNFFHYILEDRIESLNELERKVYGKLDYSIGLVPDRGEFITLNNYSTSIMDSLLDDKDNCPLTGCCNDIDLLNAIQDGNIEEYIHSIHREYEATISEDNIKELCEANEYEFLSNGKFYV